MLLSEEETYKSFVISKRKHSSQWTAFHRGVQTTPLIWKPSLVFRRVFSHKPRAKREYLNSKLPLFSWFVWHPHYVSIFKCRHSQDLRPGDLNEVLFTLVTSWDYQYATAQHHNTRAQRIQRQKHSTVRSSIAYLGRCRGHVWRHIVIVCCATNVIIPNYLEPNVGHLQMVKFNKLSACQLLGYKPFTSFYV